MLFVVLPLVVPPVNCAGCPLTLAVLHRSWRAHRLAPVVVIVTVWDIPTLGHFAGPGFDLREYLVIAEITGALRCRCGIPIAVCPGFENLAVWSDSHLVCSCLNLYASSIWHGGLDVKPVNGNRRNWYNWFVATVIDKLITVLGFDTNLSKPPQVRRCCAQYAQAAGQYFVQRVRRWAVQLTVAGGIATGVFGFAAKASYPVGIRLHRRSQDRGRHRRRIRRP